MRDGYREGKSQRCSNCKHAFAIKYAPNSVLFCYLTKPAVDTTILTTQLVFSHHTCDDWSKNEPV